MLIIRHIANAIILVEMFSILSHAYSRMMRSFLLTGVPETHLNQHQHVLKTGQVRFVQSA